MSLVAIPVAPGVSCIQETGVANFMRCNIWHVQGRDCDLVIDTGMGLNPLKQYIAQSTDKPLKAIATIRISIIAAACMNLTAGWAISLKPKPLPRVGVMRCCSRALGQRLILYALKDMVISTAGHLP